MPSKAYERLLRGLHRYVPPKVHDHPEPLRVALEQTAELFSLPAGVDFEPTEIGGVPAEWVIPPGVRSDAVLMYLHGGGYHMGSIATYRHFVGRFAEIAGLRTLQLDYRLAPEHPFPAALDDAGSVVRALIAGDVAPDRLAMAGDSAGGGLTLATLLHLRDSGDPSPAAAVLFSPWVDLTCSGASFTANRDSDPIIRAELAPRGAEWYAGNTPMEAPLVSPLFANLAGLPPMLVQVGTAEVLLDDATRLGERLRKAGGDVEVDVWDDMVHVWQYYAQWIPEARKALRKAAEYLHARLGAS